METVIEMRYYYLVNVNYMTMADYQGNWSETEISHAKDIVSRMASHVKDGFGLKPIEVSITPQPLVNVDSTVAAFAIVISAKEGASSPKISLLVREALGATREAFPHDSIEIEKVQLNRKVMKIEETVHTSSFQLSGDLR